MHDSQRLRYSRHLLLPGIGEAGQARLLAARVLIVGLGGLGSPVAMYLAAAGVGELRLADFDAVDLSNLQRQLLHTSARVGQTKVDSAIATLAALNPEVRLVPVKRALDAATLAGHCRQVDLVVDASDNFATRYAVNAACVAAGVPLVSGAAIRTEGQLAVFTGAPCYQCLYPDGGPDQGAAGSGGVGETCAREGVLAPLVGIIGSLQATEAIKLLTGLGAPLRGRLLLFDALTLESRQLAIPPDPDCPICGGR